MIISLVGLSASGKSYIADLLCNYDSRIVTLNIDKTGHQATNDEKIKEQLVKQFGESIIKDGMIYRPALSKIVFSDVNAMNILTDLTWEYMERVIDEFIANNPDKIIILDWLLLPKTKYFKTSDLRVLVTAPLEVRMARAMKRDGVTKEKFLSREANAPEINFNDFEYIINNVDLSATKKEVDEIYDKSIVHRKF